MTSSHSGLLFWATLYTVQPRLRLRHAQVIVPPTTLVWAHKQQIPSVIG